MPQEQQQLQKHKPFLKEVRTTFDATNTLIGFFGYSLSVAVFYVMANQIAHALKCDGVGQAFSTEINEKCTDLDKAAILDAGNAWSQVGVFSMLMILSTISGGIAGVSRWLWHKYSDYDESIKQPVRADSTSEQYLFTIHNPGLQEPLLDPDQKDTVIVSKIDRINQMSTTALYISRLSMLIPLIYSIPGAITIGSRSLRVDKIYLCEESFLTAVYAGSHSENCSVDKRYLAMATAFALPWAEIFWTGYTVWTLAFSFQLLPSRVRSVLSRPVERLYNTVMAYFPGDKNTQQDFKNITLLTLKSVAFAVAYAAIYPIFMDGYRLSNELLASYLCGTFFDSLFGTKVPSVESGCPSLAKYVLGPDALPLKMEGYDAYPITLGTLVLGTSLGMLVARQILKTSRTQPEKIALRDNIARANKWLDDCYDFGMSCALLFIPPSTYAFFWLAIPKANNLLHESKCFKSDYPIFMFNLFDKNCDILIRARSVSAFGTTEWTIFSYTGLLCGMVGAGLYAVQSVARNAYHFFRTPNSARYTAVSEEEHSHQVFVV